MTVESTGGQRTTARHTFAAPAQPANFQPRHVNLPVLKITTDNGAPIVSRDTYLPGQMTLESNVAGVAPLTGGLEIRGRGNSTWDLMPKKPYRLKLTDKQPLLGMPSSRDWVLLANYSDKTLLRNSIAMQLGASLGMPWTPRSAFVEVWVNNRYDGVYQLTENIKVAKDRVNIDELDEDDVAPDTISGGYLLEVDFRQDGYTIFSSIDHLPIVFQDPEEPVQAQEDYLKGYIDEFESRALLRRFRRSVDRLRRLHRCRFVRALVSRQRNLPQPRRQHVVELLDVQTARRQAAHGSVVGLRHFGGQHRLRRRLPDCRLVGSRCAVDLAPVRRPGVRRASQVDLE